MIGIYDIRYNSRLKDWVFDANRDYAGAGGIDVVRQRIFARLFIQRGTFIYDEEGNLGSRLETMLSDPKEDTQQEITIMVVEALAPMRDIIIQDVVVTVDSESDLRRPKVHLDIAIDPSVYEATEPTDQSSVPQTVSFDF